MSASITTSMDTAPVSLPHAARVAYRQAYDLVIGRGDVLEYALLATGSDSWLPGEIIPSGQQLRVVVHRIAREVRLAHDLSASIVFETPACHYLWQGSRLPAQLWRTALAGQVAYPTTLAFWKRWMAVERTWDRIAPCDGLARPQAVIEQGLISLYYAAYATDPEQGDRALVTVDRETGIVVQAVRRTAQGGTLTAILVDHQLMAPHDFS